MLKTTKIVPKDITLKSHHKKRLPKGYLTLTGALNEWGSDSSKHSREDMWGYFKLHVTPTTHPHGPEGHRYFEKTPSGACEHNRRARMN